MRFKRGDYVRKKTGGPVMTYKRLGKKLGEVICEYIDETTNKWQTVTCQEGELEIYQERE